MFPRCGGLGPSRGPRGALGPSWAFLGPSWSFFGGQLAWLGDLWGRLGHSEGPRSEYAENIRFPRGMG
eukprot:3022310-Pyramimonas_sp.AAC.1